MFTLHLSMHALLISSVVLLLSTSQPIYAVILLTLLFCEATATLFLFDVQFISLTLIVVYVGAIAVLFLFMVMMLNIKEPNTFFRKSSLVFIMISMVFTSLFYLFYYRYVMNYDFFEATSWATFKINMFDSVNNLELLGQIIHNEYSLCLIFIGLLLLVPLLGTTVLALDYKNTISNTIGTRLLSRSPNITAFFK